MDTLVKKNATVNDTIALILARINADSKKPFAQKAAALLKGNTPQETIKNVFDYVCRNVHYKLDREGKEDVYKPETTIKNGVGDCKKMTVIIASILLAAGIEPLIKHVYYKGKNYTHVYVIVPKGNSYTIVDPVNDKKFDAEVQHDHAIVYNTNGKQMDLYTGWKPTQTATFKEAATMGALGIQDDLNTVGCNMMGSNQEAMVSELIEYAYSEPSTSGKLKDKIQELKNKITQPVKQVGLAPSRAAFLLLLNINAGKIATRMAQGWAKDKAKVENFWTKFGGNVTELKKAIANGSKQNISGIGVAVTAATIAAAAAVMVPAIKLLKDLGILKPDSPETIELETNTETAVLQTPIKTVVSTSTQLPRDQGEQAPPPSAGSFATGTIDTLEDAANFTRAALMFSLGTAFNPSFIFPTQIAIAAALIYSLRKKIFTKIKING